MPGMDQGQELTPREIVAELDKYIVGQSDAKKCVAVALRNRFRRRKLPDTIKDEWIEDIEDLGDMMDSFIDAQKHETGFDIRYNTTLAPSETDWRDCAEVLSRQDLDDLMRQGWG